MHKKKKLIYLSIFFTAVAFVAIFVFFDIRSPFVIPQKRTVEIIKADNANPETPEIVENDIEELTVQEEVEETETTEPTKAETNEEKSIEDEAETELSSKLPAYIPIARNSDELTIGFITDFHAGTNIQGNGQRIIRKTFADKINYFVEKMNNETVPDFMLINGDVIEGSKTPAGVGMEQLQLIKNLFDRSAIQKYWVLGNHDLRSVTKQQWQNALGISYLKKSFELRNYKIIILDSNFRVSDKDVAPGSSYTRGHVSEKELDWLKNELKNTEKKALVFIHHPPLWGTDSRTNEGFIDNAKELRKIFSEYGALAVFGGHIEDIYYEKVDNVRYFALPGIYKNLKYIGAYSVINVKENRVDVSLSYLVNGKYTTINVKNN